MCGCGVVMNHQQELLWAKTREKVPKDGAELKKKLEEAALGVSTSES